MRSLDDTIAAVATAPGDAGVAIVRVSGPLARRVAAALLGGLDLTPRRATIVWVRDPVTGQRLDEVLSLWMPGPASYTREDVLELQGHGGPAAAGAILRAALAAGARLADPGEFTLRAYLRGRIDLVQAESVLDVIRAQTQEALAVQEDLLAGALSGEVGRWQEALGSAAARVEAHLDFPEDDLGELDRQAVREALVGVVRAMEERLATYSWGRVSREGFRVVLVGAPNVGKSSLLNALAHGEHAIVSSAPGTTRDVIEVGVDACGVPLRVVDTAGLRVGGDEVEREGVRRARSRAAGADRVVFVCDGGRRLTGEERDEAEGLAARGGTTAVVNKADLGQEPCAELGAVFGVPPLTVSAKSGAGVGDLLRALANAARGGGGPTGAGVLTRERHRMAVEEARSAVGRALGGLGGGVFPEVVAAELQGARRSLGELLGRGTAGDVLERIFAEFCVGK